MKTIFNRPHRSPVLVVEKLKPYIKDKVVCEIGCAAGDISRGFAKYAKKVIGVEKNPDFFQYLENTENITFIKADIFDIEMPIAEVYYMWMTRDLTNRVVDKILNKKKDAIIVIGIEEGSEPIPQKFESKISFKYDETDFERGPFWKPTQRERGLFHLFFVTEKPYQSHTQDIESFFQQPLRRQFHQQLLGIFKMK